MPAPPPPAQYAAPAQPQQAYAEPVPPPQAPAAPAPPADMNDRLAQLKQLGELLSAGVLTQAEFEQQKARILNGPFGVASRTAACSTREHRRCNRLTSVIGRSITLDSASELFPAAGPDGA